MFQMQSWQASAACTCDPPGPRVGHQPRCPYPAATRSWVPMEDGAAKARWKPKKSPLDAVYQCMRWTGLTGIPAMQVVDLDTGEVLWRDSSGYPNDAEPPVTPEWAVKLAAQVRREQEVEAATEAADREPRPRAGSKANPQGALW